MKKFLLLAFAIPLALSCFGQYNGKNRETESSGGASKAVYGELGGSGLIFSANFDSRFKGANGFGFRIGIGGAGGTGGGILTFPFGLNYVAGEGPHHFEAGATVTLVTAAFDVGGDSGSGWFGLPHLGYRYSQASNSFNGRIYVGPLIASDFVFFPFGGISVGFTLK